MSYASHHDGASRKDLGIAILTVSDTKGPQTDSSGDLILRLVTKAGHRPAGRAWSRDETPAIRAAADELLASPDADALIVTGGTGASPRDVTPDALGPRFSKELPGFGEYFRQLSSKTIRSGAILSRATAGLAAVGHRQKPVFLLPGAPEACELAVTKIILPELTHLVDLAHPEATHHA